MRPTALTLVTLACLVLLAPAARAQDDSPAQLRREIDRQTEIIAELEAKLARATTRIEMLEAENRRLREAHRDTPAGATDSDTAEDNAPAELPSDPFACADSLQASIQSAWDTEFATLDVSDDAQNRQYLRDVRRWAGRTERDHRGRFTWRASVLSARDEGRSTVAMVQVYDDQGRPLGAPAEIEALGSAARTVLQASSDAVLELTGTLSVNIDIDVRHGDTDDMVGPYVELTREFNVTQARYE